MKYFGAIIFLGLIGFAIPVFADLPFEYTIIEGRYENKEFGVGVTLPNSIQGFVTEIDNQKIGKITNIQAHHELPFDEPCCPSIDTSPAELLLDSHPKSMLATPVPLTGDVYAAFQGYNMDVKIDRLGDMQVLASTIEIERQYRDNPEPIKRIGKFYFVNADQRYISYGLFASEENYAKYIDEFEESAKSLTVVNAIPVDLKELFPKNLQADLRLEDNSSIFPTITTPSTLNMLSADKQSKTLEIEFTEPNEFRSFLAINVGDLLDGPYSVSLDGKSTEGQILENESGKYLIVFYSGQGTHKIIISGSSISSSSNPPSQIEKIDNMLYHVSEPLELTPDYGKIIIFHDVIFAPHTVESQESYSFVTFADGTKEAVLAHFDEPSFSESINPQAGFVQRSDGYHLLVSANLKEISPLKQIISGIPLGEIQCKDNLILIQKYDATPACVKPETISELIKRDWTTQPLVHDMVMKVMGKNISPECSKNTIDDIMRGNVDKKCSNFMEELADKHNSEMFQKGYAFDNERKAWTKKGYPDILMSLADYYRQNLNGSINPHEPESHPLDIAMIEDRYIHLNPVDMCATISLELMSPDEVHQRAGTDVFLEFDDEDIEEMPILDELIRATHHLEFPANDSARADMGLRELVDYEFFIMEKSIEKYGDTQEDYFMKLDDDLDERLADPRKQGFSNEFIAPQIVYEDKVYALSHTVFWVSDEHEMQSMSVHLKESIKDDEKFVTLNDKDMESIPKIRQAIESIGTELESVVAFKGVPEDPDWNNYREWYAKKSAEQFDLDETYVRGFVYEKEYYDLGFSIC